MQHGKDFLKKQVSANDKRIRGFSSAGRAPALHAGGQEFESPNLHHFKQIELLKSEPSGSFLMLSIHLSFEEIMADLNSANPTSALSFLKHELLPVNKLYKNSNFN